MKSILVLCSLMLLAPKILSANDLNSPRQISVTGTVSTSIAPDHIVWRISLRDTDKNLQTAKQASDEKVKAIVKLRGPLGLNDGDLETGPLYVNREYERTQHGYQGEFKYFVVTRNIVIRQHDLSQFDQFLDRLVSSAEMEVSFNFSSSKMQETRAETRLKAVEAGMKKAREMAEVAQATLGPVLSIHEHSPNQNRQGYLSNSNAMIIGEVVNPDISSERFVPGAIDVRVTVYLTFALQ